MRPPVFIGDPVTAAGYRLAGARIEVPAPGTEAAALERARGDSDLVLITAEAAARIPAKSLGQAVRSQDCLVLVVRDARSRVAPPDQTGTLRRQLGLTE